MRHRGVDRDAIYLANAFDELIRYRTFDESPGVMTQEARWRIPGFLTGDGVVRVTCWTQTSGHDHCGPVSQRAA